jgi:hypothetical protein
MDDDALKNNWYIKDEIKLHPQKYHCLKIKNKSIKYS